MDSEDEMRIEKLYKKNAPNIYKIVLHRLEDKELAENIVQEVFVILLEKWDIVKKHPNPAGWLMETVKYLILQAVRNRKRRLDYEVSIEESLTQMGNLRGQYTPSLRDMLPPGLPPSERDILVWYYEEKLSYEEIFQKYGVKAVTSRTRMSRAKKHYKELAEKNRDFLELM